MNTEQRVQQIKLAASIAETGHPWEYRSPHSRVEWQKENDPDKGVLWRLYHQFEIRLALASPGDGRVCHNPDNLTAEQVGAGWRLLLEQEFQNKLHHSVVEFWNEESKKWKNRPCPQFDYTGCSKQTYRLHISTPWPESKVEPVTVQLETKDVPPGSVFSTISIPDDWYTPITIQSSGVYFYDSRRFIKSFSELKLEWRINKSIPITGKWDADAWEKCEKEVV